MDSGSTAMIPRDTRKRSHAIVLAVSGALLLLGPEARAISVPDAFSLAGTDHKFQPDDDLSYARHDFDDSAWRAVRVPGSLEEQGFRGDDRCGWYRIRFSVPEGWPDVPLAVGLGVVWGAEQTYLNGVLIGETGTIREGGTWDRMIVPYMASTLHEVPAALLDRAGENLLALRVCNGVDSTGIVHGPAAIGDARALESAKSLRDSTYRQLDAAFAVGSILIIIVWMAFAAQLRTAPGIWQLGAALGIGLFIIVAGSLSFFEAGGLNRWVYLALMICQFAAPNLTLYAFSELFELGDGRPFLFGILLIVVGAGAAQFGANRDLGRIFMVVMYAVSWSLYGLLLWRIVRATPDRSRVSRLALATALVIALAGAGTMWTSLHPAPPDWTLRYAMLTGYWIVPLFLVFAAPRQLVRSQTRVAQLSVDLLEAVEFDRRRIARELHDGVGQTLQVAKMRLELLADSSPEAARVASEDLAHGIRDVRSVAQELRPVELDGSNLTDQISSYAESYALRLRLDLDLDLTQAPDHDLLDAGSSTHVFRILQEALGNSSRHSSATSLRVRVAEDRGAFELEVTDNGIGIHESPTSDSGIGLATMRERAELIGARFEIRDADPGTSIVLSCPIRKR
jgi:signal transduction histidine kinase